MKLLIATRNKGKRHEFESLLAPVGEIEFHDLRDWPHPVSEVDEDGVTFEHNAAKKALEVSLESGVSTLADDSGLCVDALDGAPGVFSARYAGLPGNDENNNAKLVRELSDVPEAERTARYVAVLTLCLVPGELQSRALSNLGATLGDLPELNYATFSEDQPTRHGDRLVFCRRAACEGRIILEPRGDGGFGYDPYFLIPQWNLTLAEVPLDTKNEISHRAKATREVVALLRS